MEGRPLNPLALRRRSGLGLAAALLFVQHVAAQSQQNQPGNPTTLNGFQFTDTVKFALAGGGGGLILLIVAIVIFCCCRKRRKKRNLPEAKTPTELTFSQPQANNPKPDALPAEPTIPTTTAATLPNQTATFDSSHYRQPSDRLPQAQPTYNRPSPSPPAPMYGGGGYGSLGNYGFGGQQPSSIGNVAERRGADPPAPLRMGANKTPQPPLPSAMAPRGQGAGRGGWAAVNQTQAWGMHGRHIDNHGRYFGSMAVPGGQEPGSGGGGGGGAAPVRNLPPSSSYNRRPPPGQNGGGGGYGGGGGGYGNEDPYSQRGGGGYGGGYGGSGGGGGGGGYPMANQQGNRYQGGNPYQQRSPPSRGGYGGRPSPPGRGGYGGGGGGGYGAGGGGNPYASNRDRYAQPNRGGYTPPTGGYGYGDYGAGRYGHAREGSEGSDQNYYQAHRPMAANQYV